MSQKYSASVVLGTAGLALLVLLAGSSIVEWLALPITLLAALAPTIALYLLPAWLILLFWPAARPVGALIVTGLALSALALIYNGYLAHQKRNLISGNFDEIVEVQKAPLLVAVRGDQQMSASPAAACGRLCISMLLDGKVSSYGVIILGRSEHIVPPDSLSVDVYRFVKQSQCSDGELLIDGQDMLLKGLIGGALVEHGREPETYLKAQRRNGICLNKTRIDFSAVATLIYLEHAVERQEYRPFSPPTSRSDRISIFQRRDGVMKQTYDRTLFQYDELIVPVAVKPDIALLSAVERLPTWAAEMFGRLWQCPRGPQLLARCPPDSWVREVRSAFIDRLGISLDSTNLPLTNAEMSMVDDKQPVPAYQKLLRKWRIKKPDHIGLYDIGEVLAAAKNEQGTALPSAAIELVRLQPHSEHIVLSELMIFLENDLRALNGARPSRDSIATKVDHALPYFSKQALLANEPRFERIEVSATQLGFMPGLAGSLGAFDTKFLTLVSSMLEQFATRYGNGETQDSDFATIRMAVLHGLCGIGREAASALPTLSTLLHNGVLSASKQRNEIGTLVTLSRLGANPKEYRDAFAASGWKTDDLDAFLGTEFGREDCFAHTGAILQRHPSLRPHVTVEMPGQLPSTRF